MNELGDKLVDFFYWCDKCAYKEMSELELPCRECLEEPTNQYSTKPMKWKEKETS